MTREDLVFLTELSREECAVILSVARELRDARREHRALHSAHEGYAVILEELDELWSEVMKKRQLRSRALMAREAIQIAAMGARFLLEICMTPPAALESTEVAE
jgi:hypothetical protein